MNECIGFRLGQVVVVPHQGQKRRVQIRSIRRDPLATWLIYFIDRVPYRCPAEVATPVF